MPHVAHSEDRHGYFIELFLLSIDEQTPILLYGAAWVPEETYTMSPRAGYPFREDREFSLPSRSTATLTHGIYLVEHEIYKSFEKTLADGVLDLTLLNLPDLSIVKETVFIRPPVIQLDRDSEWSRRVSSPSPESRCRQRLAEVGTYWPYSPIGNSKSSIHSKCIDIFTGLCGSAEGAGAIVALTDALEEWSGLKFSGGYAERIGCFETYAFSVRLDDEQFAVSVVSTEIHGRKVPTGVTVRCPSRRCQEHHFAHIILRNVHDITKSTFVQIPAGASISKEVHSDERISEACIDVYSRDGQLMFHEHWHAVRGIGFQMNLVSAHLRVADRFSSQKLSHRPQLQEMVESVTYGFRVKNSIAEYEADPWYPIANALRHLVSMTREGRTGDRFFKRGADGQVDVILHIKQLIEEIDNQKVIIADPFFDSYALGRVLSRISNPPKQISVITSFFAKRDDSDSETAASLRLTVQKNRTILPACLEIHDLVRGDDQAFHDRYVCLRKTDGRVVVYMLSSSLNKAAGRWPFCISALGTSVSLEICHYLENLESGRDIHTPDAEIRHNRIWPDDAMRQGGKTTATDVRTDDLLTQATVVQALGWLLDLPSGTPIDSLTSRAHSDSLLTDGQEGERIRVNGQRLSELFETAWEQRKIGDPSRLGNVLLGLGHMIARNASESVTERVIKALRERAPSPDAASDLLSYILVSTRKGEVSEISALADAAMRALLGHLEICTTGFTAAQGLIGNRLFTTRSRDWGLWWIGQALVVLDPRAVSEWDGWSSLGVVQASAIFSGWSTLCEYHHGWLEVDRLLAESKGLVFTFLMTYALGGHRIRPICTLNRCAAVLSRADLTPDLQAWVLLCSYKNRQFRQRDGSELDEEISIGLLAKVWPQGRLTREGCTDVLAADREGGPPVVSALIPALVDCGQVDNARVLDEVRVEQGKKIWTRSSEEYVSDHTVDMIEDTLLSWLRLRPKFPFTLLPHKSELDLLILAATRPFSSIRGVAGRTGEEWRRNVRVLVCCAYAGARLCDVFPSTARVREFERDFLLRVVVPVLRMLRSFSAYARDPRILDVLGGFFRRVFERLRDDQVIRDLASRISGNVEFDERIRAIAVQVLCDPAN